MNKLSAKDVAATAVMGVVVGLVAAKIRDVDAPGLRGWRMPTVALLGLGSAMCAIGAGRAGRNSEGVWRTSGTVLGGVAGWFGLMGVIFNLEWAFMGLAGTIGALWGQTTAHHTVSSGRHLAARV